MPRNLSVGRRAPATVAVTAAIALLGSAARAQTVYALSGADLVRFEANAPGVVTTIGELNADIVALDFRPADGQLYGYAAELGDGPDALYRIDTATAALTLVGVSEPATGTALLDGDFDPLRDRFRVVSDIGENHQVDPAGLATLVNSDFSYVAGDQFAGRFPLLLGIAYAPDGALYGIDYLRDTLVRFEDPDAGTLRTVGRLGVNTDRFTGFDIARVGNATVAYAALGPSFNPGVANAFFTVDLTTGAATRVGTFGAPGVLGIAVAPGGTAAAPEPGALGLLSLGLLLKARWRCGPGRNQGRG